MYKISSNFKPPVYRKLKTTNASRTLLFSCRGSSTNHLCTVKCNLVNHQPLPCGIWQAILPASSAPHRTVEAASSAKTTAKYNQKPSRTVVFFPVTAPFPRINSQMFNFSARLPTKQGHHRDKAQQMSRCFTGRKSLCRLRRQQE